MRNYRGYENVGQAAAGPRERRLQTIRSEKAALYREAVDIGRAKKEMVASAMGQNLWVDPVSGNVYKIRPKVLTSWTQTANTASTVTTIMKSSSVPNGIEYLFAPVGDSQNDLFNAPQLYGDIEDSSGSDISGEMVVRILSPSGVEKARIWTGNSKKVCLASDQGGLDVQKKIFFNVDEAVRAKSGDYLDVTLDSASTVCTTETNLTIECYELEKQE